MVEKMTTDCFKRAVEIAGWPEGEMNDLPAILTPPSHTPHVWSLVRDDVGYGIPKFVALALLEKHFREWLERHHLCVVPTHPEMERFGKKYHCSMGEAMHFVYADTYLECHCLAVIECDKKEHDE